MVALHVKSPDNALSHQFENSQAQKACSSGFMMRDITYIIVYVQCMATHCLVNTSMKVCHLHTEILYVFFCVV